MNVDIENYTSIHGENVSEAWAYTFLKCYDAPGGILAPGIVHFNAQDTEKIETNKIRMLLEKHLKGLGIRTVNTSPIETVASTIFPQTTWKLAHENRDKFFDLYNRMWPKIKKCHSNRKGVYFRRLTAFGKDKINQLNHILAAWHKGTHRHSALQAAIFDPLEDHSFQRQLGFPCLQQVIFHPNGNNGKEGLSIVALYANQLLLEKAYGNYLGLHRLGQFMASEMGIHLKDVLCIASNLKLSDKYGSKTLNKSFVDDLKKELSHGK